MALESRIGPSPRAASEGAAADLELARVYERWFDDVVRWCRALGAPESDVEDIVQEVFLVVRRKLAGFDGRNLPGWLYAISVRTVSDQRRRAFFRRVWSRRSERAVEELVDRGPGPLEHLERTRARQLVERLLAGMSDKRRVALVLFELEGYTGAELAAILGVPEKTIWTRLHHARKDFVARCRALAGTGKEE